jgi:site-specific recombinase XerC
MKLGKAIEQYKLVSLAGAFSPRTMEGYKWALGASTTDRRAFAMHRPMAVRDKALLLLLLETGLRVSDRARLRIQDVNLATGAVQVKQFGSGLKS